MITTHGRPETECSRHSRRRRRRKRRQQNCDPKVTTILLGVVLSLCLLPSWLPTAVASTTSHSQQSSSSSSSNLRHLADEEDNGPQARIHGGWETQEGRYAYAEVSLISAEGHKCGGALVAPDLIISAAHCQESESQYIEVIVGKHNANDATWETFNVAKELVHPNYNIANTRFDVMLLKSNQITQQIQPVRINDDPAIPTNGESLTVLGLGYTEEWTLPTSLRETRVTYTRNLECVDMSNADGQTLKNDLHLDMLCAGDVGRDSCYGDSGSPLVRPGFDASSDVAVGLVSWGYECGGALPGVYSRLSHWAIQEWLVETICRESVDPPAYLRCFGEPAPTQRPTSPPTPRPTPQPSIQIPDGPQQPTLVPVRLPTQEPSSGVLWDVIMGNSNANDDPNTDSSSSQTTSSAKNSRRQQYRMNLWGWDAVAGILSYSIIVITTMIIGI